MSARLPRAGLAVLKQRTRTIHGRYGKFLPALFFVAGFVWDSLTLTRIDRWFDNVVLLGYLLALGGLIVVVVLVEHGVLNRPLLLRYAGYLPFGIQFLLGGLFSAYVVYYFKSASVLDSYVFLSLLVLLLIGNEFLERRFRDLYLLVPLYFLVCFSFFLFFIPVVFKAVGLGTFIAAGLVSLGVIALLVRVFRRAGIFRKRSLPGVVLPVAALYVLINVFYAYNWIPPVPLAMTEGGVYHHARKQGDRFVLRYEEPAWWRLWRKTSDPFHYAPGDTVFCYVSVFAPTGLRKGLAHRWQRYDVSGDAWVTVDEIPYRGGIVGLRDDGYRGVTWKRRFETFGTWRVEIVTPDELTVGRVVFDLVPVDSRVTDFATRTR